MNKDIDNIDSTDKSVEKALDIMESSSEINVEQLQEMLKDEETLQACRDIMDSSLFLQQKSGMELPNIEMELERFKKKQYTARMRSNFWKVSMGIAAMIAVLFGTYYLINTLTTLPWSQSQYLLRMLPLNISLCKKITEKRLY